MKFKSLKQQLKILIVFIIFVPLSVMLIFLFNKVNKNEEQKAFEEFLIIRKLVNRTVDQKIMYGIEMIDSLKPYFRDLNDKEAYDYLMANIGSEDDSTETVVFIQNNGYLSSSKPLAINDSQLDSLKELIQDNMKTNTYSFVFDDTYLIYCTYVESLEDGAVLFTITEIDSLIEAIGNKFSNYKITTRVYIRDKLYFDSYNQEIISEKILDNREVEFLYQINNNYFKTVERFEEIGIRYELFYRFDKFEDFIIENKVLILMIFIYLLLIILAIGYFVNNLVKPIDHLNNQLSEVIDNSKEDLELIPNTTKEYDELYISFNNLTEEIKSNYENIEKQLSKIEDKNEMMLELNNQLEDSMDKIEESSAQLDYARKKNKALIDNITYMMWRIDKDKRITYINEEVKNKLGFDVDELMGKSLNSIMCPVHEYKNCYDIVEEFFKRDFIEVDLWFLQSDFEQREIYSTSTKRIYEDGELVCVQGISKLVTEDRYLQKEVKSKTEELETLNEISKLLTDFEELNTLLDIVIESIDDLINPFYASISLLEDKTLKLAAYTAEDAIITKKTVDERFSDNLKLSINDKKIILLSGNEARKEVLSFVETDFEEIMDIMYIPMEINNEVIGMLTLASKVELSEFKINVIKLFTQQASVAIDRAKIYSQLKQQYLNTIEALATAVEAKDVYTLGHSRRVALLSKLLAAEMGCEKEFVENIEQAGLLHDIGKISISDQILTKDGKLTDFEYDEIKRHPEYGEKILRPIGLSSDIIDGVLLHHVRYDLKGYPGNINIKYLPLSARIIGVADAFDAITSKRSYHDAQDIEVAIKELKRCVGSQFCPDVVDKMDHIFRHNKTVIEDIIYSKVGEVDVV